MNDVLENKQTSPLETQSNIPANRFAVGSIVLVNGLLIGGMIGSLFLPLAPLWQWVLSLLLGGFLLGANFFWFQKVKRSFAAIEQALTQMKSSQRNTQPLEELNALGFPGIEAHLKEMSQMVQQSLPPSETSSLVPVNLEKNELESVIHCMDDGLIIYDNELNVVLLNPAMAQMLIPSNPAATGRLIQNPNDKLLFERCIELKKMKEIQRAMVEEPTLPRCDVIELKAPSQFLKRYSSPLYNRFHQQIGHVIIYHDITKEVETEKMRSEFITNASHELRTPVTAIRLTLETLMAGAKDDPEVRDEFIGNLFREVERLHILVNDLLDLSRLERHEDLNIQDVDVRKMVSDAIRTVRPLATQKGIEIKENIQSEIETIQADQLRLGQVLVNLVNNAVKFTPNGGEIRVITRRMDDDIEFKIQDTGIGIPQEDLPYIFDRFYRVEQNRQRRNSSGGSGIGLSITKQVVDMHGGKISASSTPNKGTTFTFTIPQSSKVLAPVE